MAKLFKRGDVWFARVLSPDGRLRRRSTKCTDFEAAKIAARRFERESADPAHAAAHSATLARCVALFQRELGRRGRAAGTLHMYRVKIGHLGRVFGDDSPMARITAPTVDGYVSQRQSEGAQDSTIGKELTALRQILKVARRAGLYATDPGAVLPVQWSGASKARTTHVRRERVGDLLGALPPERARHVAFILATGARDAEAARARAEDVDSTAWTVRLRGTKTDGAARTVPVVTLARPLLAFALQGAPESGLLFPPWSGIRTQLVRTCARIGHPRVSPNDLRRSLATWLREGGASTEHIGRLLGHTDSRMAERVYGQLSPAALGALLERGSLSGSTSRENGSERDDLDGEEAVVSAVNAVPRDGIEPPTRGFSSRGAARLKHPDPLQNARIRRASGSNLDHYLRARVAEIQAESTVRRALRDGVRRALRQDERGTLAALHRAAVALGERA